MTDNAAQIEAWNGPVGERWVRLQTTLDAVYAAHGVAALDAARIGPGDSVLDVGCGCGATTLDAGQRVGPRGLALGVDISGPMIARARARARALPQVRFELGDVQVAELPRARFECAVSRLGVMFFDDPVRAFSNVHGALRGGGRVAFSCWQSAEENPWISLPERAAAGLVTIPEVSAGVPGPFAFADRRRVQEILEAAGFRQVTVVPFLQDLLFPGPHADAVQLLVQFGLLGRALGNADAETRGRVVTAVEDALGPYRRAAGFVMPSRGWLVTAVRG